MTSYFDANILPIMAYNSEAKPHSLLNDESKLWMWIETNIFSLLKMTWNNTTATTVYEKFVGFFLILNSNIHGDYIKRSTSMLNIIFYTSFKSCQSQIRSHHSTNSSRQNHFGRRKTLDSLRLWGFRINIVAKGSNPVTCRDSDKRKMGMGTNRKCGLWGEEMTESNRGIRVSHVEHLA